ncbi:TNF receptor-associated factor 4-like [Stylophora pistillata]|uniref:TNF receptor-associated factor 4-like n=1 Tax=Stylophora pistillata TaxID=50429 RepID=UPI000C03A26D|nr:TNF receptor-associated factor 4-like [Stylophora pistillata]
MMQVSTHIEDGCPVTIISCPYAEIGCETKVQRRERECHLQSAMRVHLEYAILPWPFEKKVKFTLIDQQENLDQREYVATVFVTQNLSNFVRPLTEGIAGKGWRTFKSHEKLYSRHFNVDDTLFLQVEISSSSS